MKYFSKSPNDQDMSQNFKNHPYTFKISTKTTFKCILEILSI